MLPKPPNWPSSNPSNNAQGKPVALPPLSEEEAARAMPPPALPSPAPGLLDTELNGLAISLRNAMVKTGQVYRFYADAQRMGIAHHTSTPPSSLSSSLGREIEKYDQLCDCIEAHLLRAIAVLQRDARREEIKIKAAEAEAKAKAAAEAALAAATTAQEATQQVVPPTPTNSSHPSPVPVTRRPSAISISALHRPSIPPKLDLSSNTLRAEDVLYPSGLASPVTLAPKSARPVGPNEFPPEFMAAFTQPAPSDHARVDIDLTVPDAAPHDTDDAMALDPTAGSSADKPIELDFDMGIFEESAGDTSQVGELFGSGTNGESSTQDQTQKVDDNFLQALGVPEHDTAQQILASFTNEGSNPSENTDQNLKAPQTGEASAPSPNTLVSGFAASQMASGSSNQSNISHFDFSGIDLSAMQHFQGDFFGGEGVDMNFNMDMSAYLGMDAAAEGKDVPEEAKQSSGS
ncbi:hypothetical protein AX16_000634 [Volvariella volvacea WC 439]|nr:hypothetical protein AX16_000634 [Volvariella volvacea WC 439]